jgi:hypothetical protein
MIISRKTFIRPVCRTTEAEGSHTRHHQAGKLERPIAAQPKKLGTSDTAPRRHKLVLDAP